MIWEEFCSGTYQLDVPVSAQRTINLIPRRMEVPGTKSRFSFRATPGFSLFSNFSAYAAPETLYVVRGATPSADRLFSIAAGDFLEVGSTGTPTDRGNIVNGTLPSITDNGVELLLTGDGVNAYTYQLASNALSSALTNFTPSKLRFLDGYFISFKAGTQEFYISDLYDGSTWRALDFGTAEQSPDDILDQLVDHGELWLGGTESVQPFRNTGNEDFPFEALSSRIEYGVLPGSMLRHDNSIFMIGVDSRGGLSVHRVDGYQPLRISTSAIDDALAAIVGPVSANCFSYSDRGHSCYVISKITPTSGSSLTTSYCFDSATGLWHEWAHLNSATLSDDTFSELGIVSHVYAFGKHLVAHPDFTGIYEMSSLTDTDALAPAANSTGAIKSLRRAPIPSERKRAFISMVGLDCKTGATWKMKRSTDGGVNFGSEVAAIGDPPKWHRCGSGLDVVLQISSTTATDRYIASAQLEAAVGSH